MGNDGARAKVGALQIDIDDLVPEVFRRRDNRAQRTYGRIVHQSIDPTVFFQRERYDALHVLRFRNVRIQNIGVQAGALELIKNKLLAILRNAGNLRRVEAEGDDLVAAPRQKKGNGGADTKRASRYDDDFHGGAPYSDFSLAYIGAFFQSSSSQRFPAM